MSPTITLNPATLTPDFAALEGKHIVVTGAAQGIGRAVTIALAKAGVTVIMVDNKARHLETLYDAIVSDKGTEPVIAPLELKTLDAEAATQFAQHIYNEFGHLDGLLHNAAELGSPSPMDQYDLEYWQATLQVNAQAPYLLTRALLPVLKQATRADIVFTSADCGRQPSAYWGAYAIAYAAVETQAKIWSEELAQVSSLHFNTLDPGPARTALRRRSHPGEDQASLPLPQSLTPAYLALFDSHHAYQGEQLRIKFENAH